MSNYLAIDIIRKTVKSYSVLSSSQFQKIFHCTAFKKQMSYFLDENQQKFNMSHMFLLLPSAWGSKKNIMQFKNNVHLHPIDVSYDDLKELNNNSDFDPFDLDNETSRQNLLPLFYKYMNSIAEISNHNLKRNPDAFLSSGGKIDPNTQFAWIDNSHVEAEQKFQLTYQISIIESKNPIWFCKFLPDVVNFWTV